MNTYFTTGIGALVAIMLCAVVSAFRKDTSLLLTILICVLVAMSALKYLQPVINFINNLKMLANLDASLLTVMLKSVGIGILGEIISSVCADAGNNSVGKTIQFLTTATLLCIAIPLFEEMLSLIQEILNTI